MEHSTGDRWKYQIAVLLTRVGRCQTAPNLTFQPGEVVSMQYTLDVSVVGEVLRLPPYTGAVLQGPGGDLLTCYPGDNYINLQVGKYPIYFIDLHQQNFRLPEARYKTSDTWEVQLKVELVWEVAEPALVLSMRSAVAALTSACQSVLTDYVRSKKHDDLVVGPGAQPEANAAIAASLKHALGLLSSLSGIRIIDILVLDRQGDSRQTDVVQQKIVKLTEMEQVRELREKEADLQAQNLLIEQNLFESRAELELRKARAERARAAELELLRIRKAEISRLEGAMLLPLEEKEIELRQLAEVQRLTHEREMKQAEIRGAVLTELARAVVQNQVGVGLAPRGADPASQQLLVQALASLVEGMPGGGSNVTAEGRGGLRPLKERLWEELMEINAMFPRMRDLALEPVEDGVMRAKFVYGERSYTIDCGEEYPFAQPRRIEVVSQDKERWQVRSLPVWTEHFHLKDALTQVVAHLPDEPVQFSKSSGVKASGQDSGIPAEKTNEKGI